MRDHLRSTLLRTTRLLREASHVTVPLGCRIQRRINRTNLGSGDSVQTMAMGDQVEDRCIGRLASRPKTAMLKCGCNEVALLSRRIKLPQDHFRDW